MLSYRVKSLFLIPWQNFFISRNGVFLEPVATCPVLSFRVCDLIYVLIDINGDYFNEIWC
jgi:hypothetical protein